MEVLLGSAITFVAILLVRRLLDKEIKSSRIIRGIRYSQSHIFDLMPYKNFIQPRSMPVSQATRHHEQNSLKVIFYDNLAYWISDNTLVCSEIVNGQFQKELAKPVDTISMDKVQLDNIKFIVEKLTEGIDNDHRSSGN